jgi:hypothetical protein
MAERLGGVIEVGCAGGDTLSDNTLLMNVRGADVDPGWWAMAQGLDFAIG